MARIKHVTLQADAEATVSLDSDVSTVEVLNRNGADEVYFRVDPPAGFTVTVKGEDCEVLPAAINSQVVRSRATGSTTIKLRSLTAVEVTVKSADDA